MSRQAERKLMLEQAFKKWQLSINSYEMLEDFLWRRSTNDYLLGPLVIDPMFEMEPEDTRADPRRPLSVSQVMKFRTRIKHRKMMVIPQCQTTTAERCVLHQWM